MVYGFGDKAVFVLGLGISGKGTVQALLHEGVEVYGWDDGADARGEEWIARDGLTLRDPAGVSWADYAALVKTPGIPLTSPAVQAALAANIPVMGDMDLLWRREGGHGARFIGITGSNGKSTTTMLVAHILKEAGYTVASGGNVGNAALSLPELEKGGFYVLECSSYQLETLHEMRFDAAAILNLTPNHLERHKDMAQYFAVKQRIFANSREADVKVMGIDQPLLRDAATASFVTVSVEGQPAVVRVDESGTLYDGEMKIMNVAALTNLRGLHNRQNVAAAWALVRRWVKAEVFAAAVETFQPLPHRMEIVWQAGDLTFINDSKATSGESASYALQGVENVYWICGGRPKIGGLGPALNHLENVQAAFTIGEAEEAFAAELEAKGVPVFRCGTLEKAVVEATGAAQLAEDAACVLLSPACESFDQFKSFEHRGDCFVQLVRGLAV